MERVKYINPAAGFTVVRPAAKFWGSLTLLILAEAFYTTAYLYSYIAWDIHYYYIFGVFLFGLWLFYATSLVVKGPLFAAPGLLVFCLVIFTVILRSYQLDSMITIWEMTFIFLCILMPFIAIIARYYRGSR